MMYCLVTSSYSWSFACSVEDGEYLISLAKERNLFVMEGIWTRFFPAVQKARDPAMGSDKLLGEIAAVYSDFNFNAADSTHIRHPFYTNENSVAEQIF
ncbi:MAG: putative dehydrogenase [Bacillariaceae sp.]|jgi:predicted dehydrogenase